MALAVGLRGRRKVRSDESALKSQEESAASWTLDGPVTGRKSAIP